MTHCPKCDVDVLVGDMKLPNHCPGCHYEWEKGEDPMDGEKNPKHKGIAKEDITRIPILKSRGSLMTFNNNLRKPNIVDRIDSAIENINLDD